MVANRGNATAEDVVLTNPVPQNTTFSGSDHALLAGSCDPGAAPGTNCRWALGDLPAGASVTVEATYALEQSETAYNTYQNLLSNYSFSNTASAEAANGGGTPSNTDSSLVRAAYALVLDTHVDDARPDTAFGSCPTLQVRGDNALTAFLDHSSVSFGSWARDEDLPGGVESMWAAELRASASSATASPGATIGAHRIVSHRWSEGTGSCAGADGSGRDARAPSATEPDTEPVSEAFAVASVPVAGPGPVRWDVRAAFDTHAERLGFNGFELRAGLGLSALDAFAFHSSEAPAPADWPLLVTLRTQNEGSSRCVDADRETATGPSHRAQRIDAYVTDSNVRVSNSGGDGCNGYPVAGAPVGWELDDDSPDAYISNLEGTAVRREVGRSGDVGPNLASTRTDANGHTFIKTALADPLAEGVADTENRVAAIFLPKHDGYIAPGIYPSANQGVCEPGQVSHLGSACSGSGESQLRGRRSPNLELRRRHLAHPDRLARPGLGRRPAHLHARDQEQRPPKRQRRDGHRPAAEERAPSLGSLRPRALRSANPAEDRVQPRRGRERRNRHRDDRGAPDETGDGLQHGDGHREPAI